MSAAGRDGAARSQSGARSARASRRPSGSSALGGGAPRKLGGGRIAGRLAEGRPRRVRAWRTDLAGAARRQDARGARFQARGQCGRPVWSPDGARIAFTISRGDHGFIGVYDVAADALRYLDPSTDYDLYPEWSPDSRSIAFVRHPIERPARGPRGAARRASPGRSASRRSRPARAARSGARSEGRGSVFREVTAAQPVAVGRRRPHRLPVGGRRLDASVLGRRGGRRGDAADARRVRSGGRGARTRQAGRDLLRRTRATSTGGISGKSRSRGARDAADLRDGHRVRSGAGGTAVAFLRSDAQTPVAARDP